MKLKQNKVLALLLGSVIALTGCGNTSSNSNEQDQTVSTQGEYSIDFDSENYTVKSTTVDGETIYYRAFEGIVYVSNPVDTEYQSLNFYVPESYYEGETINGYTIDTAPIFFANSVGGYMPATASSIDEFTEGGLSIGGHSIDELTSEDDSQISGQAPQTQGSTSTLASSSSTGEVIQLSSTTPQGDAPRGNGEAPQGDAPGNSGEAPQGDAPGSSGEAPQGDASESNGEAPQGDAPGNSGETPQGDAPGSSGEVSQGDAPEDNGEAPQGDTPEGNGEAPQGDTQEGNGEAPQGDTPEGNGEAPQGDAPRGNGTGRRGADTEDEENTFALALSRGYVVASVGTRGRTNVDENGNYTGKAPAVIVDLKAAVRYLRYNDDVMAGDAEKIISNGTSAGGGVSLLLGATGNNADYESYLEELGAAPATDDIFAVSAFCPITNLENADMAYEWQFNEVVDYEETNVSVVDGEIVRENSSSSLTETQQQYSDELKQNFIEYLNSLQLVDSDGNELTLSSDGEGTFKAYIAYYVMASAQKALDDGEDLSSYTWLEIEDNQVISIDLDSYFEYMGRSKVPTAFDSVDLSSGENSLFGTETIDAQHFTEFGLNNSTENGTMADSQIIKLMNPLNYIGDSETTNATYWRIRHGSIDSDTSLAIPAIVANILEQNGYSVDFALQWNTGHTGDYDLEGLFDWIDSIAK